MKIKLTDVLGTKRSMKCIKSHRNQSEHLLF